MRIALTRRNDTNGPLGCYEGEIDRFFNDFFSTGPVRIFNEGWYPRVDVVEDENSFHVTADIPGVSEKEINVTVENGVLSISGERKTERTEEDEKKRYHVSERSYGSFHRTVTLPERINAEGIRANFKDGVLNIEIPKSEEVKPRKIAVTMN